LLVPAVLTATPKQCSICHEMRPYYESWQASSHRAAVTSCQTCHVKPGILHLVAFEFGSYRMLFAHFAGVPVTSTPANAPSVESCRRAGCHSLNREVSNSGDLKINHRLHVTTENIACPTCHPGAVHAGVGGRVKLPPMKLCTKCHADKMSDCSFCHTEQHLQALPGVHDATPTVP
jgi:trimethylamine-N-oxide reductase cytochrome c-type subunit TorC